MKYCAEHGTTKFLSLLQERRFLTPGSGLNPVSIYFDSFTNLAISRLDIMSFKAYLLIQKTLISHFPKIFSLNYYIPLGGIIGYLGYRRLSD